MRVVPIAMLSHLLPPLGMKQHLSEQQQDTTGQDGDGEHTQENCCNTGSGLFINPVSHCSQTNAEPSTTATFPMRHRNQQPGMGKEKLKELKAVSSCGGLDKHEVCSMAAPGPCVEGLHFAWSHSASHGMAIPAVQQGWLPSGAEEWRCKWLRAPLLPVRGGMKPPPTILPVTKVSNQPSSPFILRDESSEANISGHYVLEGTQTSGDT